MAPDGLSRSTNVPTTWRTYDIRLLERTYGRRRLLSGDLYRVSARTAENNIGRNVGWKKPGGDYTVQNRLYSNVSNFRTVFPYTFILISDLFFFQSRILLFLPFRIHANFTMDLKYFFECLGRPANDPMSFHSSLLYALYAVACCFGGAAFFSQRDYFVVKARQEIENSLRDVDRLAHSMWASVVLSSYFINVGRLPDAYAMISPTARFAIACGLDGVTNLNRSAAPDFPLLHPPMSEAEARDRIHLSHAIYMAERTLSMISGLPSIYRTLPRNSSEPGAVIKSPDESPNQGPDDILNVCCYCSILSYANHHSTATQLTHLNRAAVI